MIEYRRFISYMYIYKNGSKDANAGYVKIESKSGKCKLSVNIKSYDIVGKDMEVFMFYRAEDGVTPVKIHAGTTIPKSNICDVVFKTDSDNIFDSGKKLEMIGGVIAIIDGRSIYATEWDDKGIDVNRISINSNKLNEYIEDNNNIIEKEYKKINEVNDVIIEKDKEDKQINIDENKDKHTDNYLNSNIDKSKDYTKNDVEKYRKYEQQDTSNISEYNTSNDQNIGSKVVQEFNIKEKQNISSSNLKEHINNNQQYNEKETEIKLNTKLRINSEQDTRVKMQSDSKNELSKRNDVEILSAESNGKNSLIKRIFEKFPGMYPFEDDEIIDCVKLEPYDIGIFPMDKWVLANNSFLLHGFYTYRHLIFAKKRANGHNEYILGVPGIYRDRERFMAGMFGFNNFKSVRNTKRNTGDFGYWYMEIRL